MRANGRFWAVPALACALTLSACENDLTEINRNPNEPEDVPAANLLLGGMWDVMANQAERGVFGYWTMLYHAENWAQHVSQPAYNDEDRYLPREGLPGNMWEEMFYALNDLDQAKRLATTSNDNNLWAVAEIMTVYGFAHLSDYWGDIPYTDALRIREGVAFPKYSKQSEIYPDLVKRLAAAAAKINVAGSASFHDFDPIFQGDMQGWKEFANSLQLRLAMRMATASPAAASAAFKTAWAADVFDNVGDNATADWTAATPSENSVYYLLVYSGRSGDFRMSESLVERMKSRNDPRLPIYADPAADGQYRGLRNGKEPADYTFGSRKGGSADFSTIGEHFQHPETPSVLMSYSEMLFLAAEAAQRGWISGSPATYYQQAITASMNEYGISSGATASYLSRSDVAYKGLSDIWLQKWISLFLAGEEAFNELRRVGWMDLKAADNSYLDPGQFPARLLYPAAEALYNPQNSAGYVDLELTAPVWWMSK